MALGAVGLSAVASPAGADEDFVKGSGMVSTRVVQIGPTLGRLSFAPTVGVASADYTSTAGRAESKVLDYAALDSSLPEQLVDASPPLRTDSNEDGAADGKSVTTAGLPEQSPIKAGGTTQSVRAGTEPYGEATFTLGDFTPAPGAVEMHAARAVSRAGVEGATRAGTGVVTIGRLVLGGGAAVLEGLEWEVHQRTGAHEEAGGSFTVKGMTVAGQHLAPPAPDQLTAAFTQINEALKPLGIRLDAPVVTVAGGVASISPLGIHLSSSEPGRTAGAPLVGALQPVRDPITTGIIAANAQAGGLVTLGDVAVAALTGNGGIDLHLGGGTAFTEGTRYDNPFGSFDLGSGASGPVALGGDYSSSSSSGGGDLTSALPSSGDAGTAAAGAGHQDGKVQLAGAHVQRGSTGGAAAVVGLVGLLAVLSMAGADWWRLRHEPRTIVAP